MSLKFSPNLPAVLKNEVEQTFGRRIVTSKDCIQLSEEIFSKTKVQINANTLRRCFGLVYSPHPPSHATLSILSRYCGFDSIEELPEKESVVEKVEFVKQEEVLHFLVTLFRDIEAADSQDATYMSVVKQVILFINRRPHLAAQLQTHIAKTKNGQHFYFEKYVNIDRLNSFYGEGLRYYLNEKKTAEAGIFVHSLLCFRYWLTNQPVKLQKCYQHTLECHSGKVKNLLSSARCFAVHLYHAQATGQSADKTLIDLHKYYLGLFQDNGATDLLHLFVHLVSEALVLTGHYNEGLYYVKHASENNVKKIVFYGDGVDQAPELLEAIALAKLGHKNEAENIFKHLNPSGFCFLTKKYNSILYLILCILLKKKAARYNEQLAALISETGFVQLTSLL